MPDSDSDSDSDSGASPDQLDALGRLMQTLARRAIEMPQGSYTTKLLAGGPEKIGEKIIEEAHELIEAAGEFEDAVTVQGGKSLTGREHFIYEAGDLIYHTLVLLAWKGVTLGEVADELARREGTSGLAEKASRPSE